MLNNRVLVRRGARQLTTEEQERVNGGFATSPCVTTGGVHGTPTDIYCPDCLSC